MERYAVALVALAAVLARLPLLTSDPTSDEAGFLMVGQQWHAGGSSLYGDYWVDRPPLLISIFRVAAQLGGLVPLRLIGCVATVAVVLGTAHVARRLGGPRAAAWAALVAGALCVSPLLGAQAVNGELLSAPFVVGGLVAVLAAVDQPRDHRGDLRASWAAGLAGALLMASLLVKQNMGDVAVFAAVVLLLAWRRGELTTSRLGHSVLSATAGALVCLAAVALWTVAHGTSLVSVYDAMYPFRVEAGRVMAASNRTAADHRLSTLVVCWVVSGGALVMVVAAHGLRARRLRTTAVWGLVAMVVFDVVSIALGESYWTHYLVQLVVPVAVLAGVLVAGRQRGARTVAVAVAVAALVAVGAHLSVPHPRADTSIGRAVQQVSDRQDTIVTTWGHAGITRASGLSSPYPYLWSLPAHTLDPHLTALSQLLAGPRAPTWFVTWHGTDTWRFDGRGPTLARVLAEHYRPVAQVGRHTIYLHRGVARATPRLSPPRADLSLTSPSTTTLKELP